MDYIERICLQQGIYDHPSVLKEKKDDDILCQCNIL